MIKRLTNGIRLPADNGLAEPPIPDGWATTTLGEGLIDDAQPGFACGANTRGGDHTVPHLRPMNVTVDGTIDLTDLKSVPECEVDRDARWLRSGDVLFNNTNSPPLVGKTAFYADYVPRAFSNHMTRLRCHENALDGRFCAHFLHYLWQCGYFESICNNHVSQASISRSALFETVVAIAPLSEQRRIVVKVEELLARVNGARDRLAKVPAILKRFSQSVLAAACSGQLTADWREIHSPIEHSDSLLERIGTKELSDDLAFGDHSATIPTSWRWAQFGPLMINHDSRRVPLKQEDRDKRPGRYPYYGAFGIIDEIDDFLFDQPRLLIAEDGKNLESRLRPIALIAEGQYWVNNHAHVLQTRDGMVIGYLKAFFNSPLLDLSQFLTGIDQVKLNRAALDRIPRQSHLNLRQYF